MITGVDMFSLIFLEYEDGEEGCVFLSKMRRIEQMRGEDVATVLVISVFRLASLYVHVMIYTYDMIWL